MVFPRHIPTYNIVNEFGNAFNNFIMHCVDESITSQIISGEHIPKTVNLPGNDDHVILVFKNREDYKVPETAGQVESAFSKTGEFRMMCNNTWLFAMSNPKYYVTIPNRAYVKPNCDESVEDKSGKGSIPSDMVDKTYYLVYIGVKLFLTKTSNNIFTEDEEKLAREFIAAYINWNNEIGFSPIYVKVYENDVESIEFNRLKECYNIK